MFYLQIIGMWFLFLLVAVTLGGLRDKLLKPRLGDFRAHQVGTLLVMFVFWLMIYAFVALIGVTPAQALWIGLCWSVATVAFEFLFFHYVGGEPWSALIEQYHIHKGNLWLLIILSVLLMPWLIARFLI